MPDTAANYRLIHGDCRKVLPTLPAGSFDVVFTDPPYPCIKRSYGTWTEAEWFDLMRTVVLEVREVLKPSGSAVFVLQPNSERVGRMRTWLWEFLAWVGKEWGIVQDAWWWNNAALPSGGCNRKGLLRGSLKACVWLGASDCYRNQEAVLIRGAKPWMRRAQCLRTESIYYPSGQQANPSRITRAVLRRGGSTPFNVLPMGPGHPSQMGGCHGHGAATPLNLCSWWIRYLCPPGGAVLDPFCGSGTAGVAALRHGASFTGIESVVEYVDIARRRLDAEVCQSA